MLHILHAADLHLDAPFSALTAEQAQLRRAEQRLLPDKLADVAIQRGADLVLLSGDLFDGGETYRETLSALADALGRIPAPVLIAPGNHDPYSPRSPYAGSFWPKNVLIFPSQAVQSVDLPDCTVYGSAFTGPFRDDSPLAGFHAAPSDKPALMVLHGDVDGGGRYAPIRREEIAQSGLTYLALGHIHACSGLQKSGDAFWAYPGCPEGRGFDETGDKGALWIAVDGRDVTAEFLPLGARRYELVEADLTGKDPAAAVENALAGGRREDICRLILTGECAGAELPALTELAAPYRWAITLRDHTRLPRDLWARREEDSLTGLFLRNLDARLADASPEERAALELAARFGTAALENGEDCCP